MPAEVKRLRVRIQPSKRRDNPHHATSMLREGGWTGRANGPAGAL